MKQTHLTARCQSTLKGPPLRSASQTWGLFCAPPPNPLRVLGVGSHGSSGTPSYALRPGESFALLASHYVLRLESLLLHIPLVRHAQQQGFGCSLLRISPVAASLLVASHLQKLRLSASKGESCAFPFGPRSSALVKVRAPSRHVATLPDSGGSFSRCAPSGRRPQLLHGRRPRLGHASDTCGLVSRPGPGFASMRTPPTRRRAGFGFASKDSATPQTHAASSLGLDPALPPCALLLPVVALASASPPKTRPRLRHIRPRRSAWTRLRLHAHSSYPSSRWPRLRLQRLGHASDTCGLATRPGPPIQHPLFPLRQE